MSKIEILGVGIDNLSMDETVSRIGQAIASKERMQVNTLNAEILYQALHDSRLMETINGCDLVTPDGTGIVWASEQLGTPCKERVTGIDLLNNLLKQSPKKGYKIYFYGSKPEILERAIKNIRETYPGINIVGSTHGYIKEDEQGKLLQDIQKKEPDLLFVALGAPRQEYWIESSLKELPSLVAVGVGGSLDVISGELKRAPEFFQKLRLEWLYRALIQPSRFKRLMVLPRFMLAVKRQKRAIKKS
ncbi:WecB/TagA/CpsF family glycosyltransferase [Clostridia bacterium]|nr:WecB/TagA/CpsF family glycosyltransferase [Clostridia bacterium]